MKITLKGKQNARLSGEVTLIGCFSGDLNQTASFAEADADTRGLLFARARKEGFTGKVGQLFSQFAPTHDLSAPHWQYVLFGLGERSKLTVESLRQAATAAFREAKSLKATSVVIRPICLVDTQVTSYQLGETMAAYAGMIDYVLNHQKTSHSLKEPETHIENLHLESDLEDVSQLELGLQHGFAIANSVKLARDLSNEPAETCTPRRLADVAAEIAEQSDGTITAEFYDAHDLKAMGANAILAVNRGSALPPVLIELVYTPTSGATEEELCYVGKGITFDSGGLDLKPADGMRHMKRDMSGAAVVLGTIQALAAMGVKQSVRVVIAATENMPDGRSYKPGDVLKTMAGITVEVDNTDAEGRLTLADAICFAKKQFAKLVETGAAKRQRLVDICTLTGAVKSIGGDVACGLFSNDDAYRAQIEAAAKAAGELVQPMIMFTELRQLNHTRMADLKNSGGPLAGATTAAWFVREFAGDTLWAHMDIAGVAYRDRELGPDPKDATGYGVRTLIELARLNASK